MVEKKKVATAERPHCSRPCTKRRPVERKKVPTAERPPRPQAQDLARVLHDDTDLHEAPRDDVFLPARSVREELTPASLLRKAKATGSDEATGDVATNATKRSHKARSRLETFFCRDSPLHHAILRGRTSEEP